MVDAGRAVDQREENTRARYLPHQLALWPLGIRQSRAVAPSLSEALMALVCLASTRRAGSLSVLARRRAAPRLADDETHIGPSGCAQRRTLVGSHEIQYALLLDSLKVIDVSGPPPGACV